MTSLLDSVCFTDLHDQAASQRVMALTEQKDTHTSGVNVANSHLIDDPLALNKELTRLL